MITRQEYDEARLRAFSLIEAAGFPAAEGDKERTVAADFGLSDLKNEGAQILTFFNTDRISGKLIELQSGQTLPEHWHPPVLIGDIRDPGKEETLRVLAGTLYYVDEGEGPLVQAKVPKNKYNAYSCRNEHVMKRGEQVTIEAGRKHWMQGGADGCIVFSFSTCVRDVLDQFTDPDIERTTKIIDS